MPDRIPSAPKRGLDELLSSIPTTGKRRPSTDLYSGPPVQTYDTKRRKFHRPRSK